MGTKQVRIQMVNICTVMAKMSNGDKKSGLLIQILEIIYSKAYPKRLKTWQKSKSHVNGYFRADIEAIICVSDVTKLSTPPLAPSPQVCVTSFMSRTEVGSRITISEGLFTLLSR